MIKQNSVSKRQKNVTGKRGNRAAGGAGPGRGAQQPEERARSGERASGRTAARCGGRARLSWWERQERQFRSASGVVKRIRRRYRRQFGRQADWKGYVASLVGVSVYTVGAWGVGVQRPTVERARVLRRICAELGKVRAAGERSES